MLAKLIPGPLVRWFARPYVAGGSLADGIRKAADLLDHDVLATLDLLGEGVLGREEVVKNIAAYERLADELAAHARLRASKASISLKPSAFTENSPADAADPIRALVQHCDGRGVPVTLDMEDRRWTDMTLDLAIELFQKGLDVGAVLQTRLHRTEEDVKRIPEGMRVRLVIGIYPEPGEVALVKKRPMKERMLDSARRLLEQGARVEFATHDEEYLDRFLRDVAPLAPDRCEIQMLLGVPRWDFIRRVRSGGWRVEVPVRLYIPFALGWDEATAYLRRRMKESPGIVWLVLRNFRLRGRGP